MERVCAWTAQRMLSLMSHPMKLHFDMASTNGFILCCKCIMALVCVVSTYLLQELELREQANAVLKHKVSELERKEKQEALGTADIDRPQLPDAGTKGQSHSPIQVL